MAEGLGGDGAERRGAAALQWTGSHPAGEVHEVVATLAHLLLTPATIMAGFASELLAHGDRLTTDEQRALLHRVSEQAGVAIWSTQRVLSVSRVATHSMLQSLTEVQSFADLAARVDDDVQRVELLECLVRAADRFTEMAQVVARGGDPAT